MKEWRTENENNCGRLYSRAMNLAILLVLMLFQRRKSSTSNQEILLTLKLYNCLDEYDMMKTIMIIDLLGPWLL